MCRIYHNSQQGYYIRPCSHARAPRGTRLSATKSSIALTCRTQDAELWHQLDNLEHGRNPFTNQPLPKEPQP